MKYDTLDLQNIGPIKEGRIKRNKINVFFGPNNSGKSIVSRLIYGIGQLDTTSQRAQMLIKSRIKSKNELSFFYGQYILNAAGIKRHDILSYNKKTCSITLSSKKKIYPVDFGVINSHMTNTRIFLLQHHMKRYLQNSKDSVYIPAGRTGTIQFFTAITQVRNRLLNDLLGTFRGDSFSEIIKTSAKDIKNFTRSLDKLPEHLEQFHDLILDVHTKGLNKNAQELFSNLFPGSIKIVMSRGLPEVIYRDSTGFETEIESTGSGVVSSFPIVAGVYYVKKGGTLIIEEPEAHLEPSKQLKLIEELVRIANTKKIDLIFTTHSDYVVRKFLALVNMGKIKHTELGLYYFNRPLKSLTKIEKIHVDKTGESEQPLFEDALNTLVKELSY